MWRMIFHLFTFISFPPYTQLAKRIGEEWAKMSGEEKRPYIERSEGLKRAYAQNMAIFRANRA